MKSRDQTGIYRIAIVSKTEDEQEISALVLRSIAMRPLTLRELRTEENDESGEVIFEATVESGSGNKKLIDELARELKLHSRVMSADWSAATLETD